MTIRLLLLGIFLLLVPDALKAQTPGERLRGAGEGALIAGVTGASLWGTYCAAAEPDDDTSWPECALWGGVYHLPFGLVAGLGLASDRASTLGGRLAVVGLATMAGVGVGAAVAVAGGDDYGSAVVGFGALGMGTGIVVAGVGPWLHRRLGRPVAVTPTPSGFALRVGVR